MTDIHTIANNCRCGRPTRDHAYVCDDCADKLAQALGDIPWLDDELQTTTARQQGIDYRRLGGGKGGKKPAEMPSLANMAASEARSHLRALLTAWVLFAHQEGVRSSDPREGLPAEDLPAMSRWLMWRVDGLALHEIGSDAVDEIIKAVRAGTRIVDRPEDRQYLGDCTECETGRFYATPHGSWATCNTCGAVSAADPVRQALLKKLDDRLCTAAEIADLSTYMGLHANREQVRNRVNQWHKRKVISREASLDEAPVFRFGIVWRLLIQSNDQDAAKRVG